MSLEDFIIHAYCQICAGYAAVVHAPLRRRGFAPALSDEEVLTMEFVGAYLGLHQDQQIWAYFRRHWQPWFPALGCLCNKAQWHNCVWGQGNSVPLWLCATKPVARRVKKINSILKQMAKK